MPSIAVPARKKAFTKEFLNKKFDKKHRESYPDQDISGQLGFPDVGSGRYSKELSYKGWYDFNNGQRAHLNSVE